MPRSKIASGGRAASETVPCERKDGRTLLRKIAEGTHVCGDPGMQFDTTIHKWHTCKGTGRQNSTNPCSEYLFLDNTACNLASLNLMKFKTADGAFDVKRFKAAVRIDTPQEAQYYANGGILQYVLRQLLASKPSAQPVSV